MHVQFRRKNPKQAANVGVHVFLFIDSKLACIPAVDLHLYHHTKGLSLAPGSVCHFC